MFSIVPMSLTNVDAFRHPVQESLSESDTSEPANTAEISIEVSASP
jgi:hypothetical protein